MAKRRFRIEKRMHLNASLLTLLTMALVAVLPQERAGLVRKVIRRRRSGGNADKNGQDLKATDHRRNFVENEDAPCLLSSVKGVNEMTPLTGALANSHSQTPEISFHVVQDILQFIPVEGESVDLRWPQEKSRKGNHRRLSSTP